MDLATCFGKEVVSIMWPERIESRHLKIVSVDVVDGNFFWYFAGGDFRVASVPPAMQYKPI